MRCQRCNRPVCPQCQRPAPVGVQCVDCVADAAKAARSTVTVFGGRATDGRPVLTYALMAVCAVLYLAQMAIPAVTDRLAFAPYLGWQEPWRFLTAGFLHSPNMVAHILFNMFALWSMGQYLEPMLGRARYGALYLLSTLGGTVAVTLLAGRPTVAQLASGQAQAWVTGVVGASGAIFGLFGALLVLNRSLGRNSSAMYATLAINAVLGFLYSGISWQAHLGGFVTGLACAGIVVAFKGRDRGSLLWAGLAGVLVVLVLAVGIDYLTLPEPVRNLPDYLR